MQKLLAQQHEEHERALQAALATQQRAHEMEMATKIDDAVAIATDAAESKRRQSMAELQSEHERSLEEALRFQQKAHLVHVQEVQEQLAADVSTTSQDQRLDLSNVSAISIPGSPIKVVHVHHQHDDLEDASSSDDEISSSDSDGSLSEDDEDSNANDLSWL